MSDYRICTRCVMDTSDPEIIFDKNGVCNHCKEAEKKLQSEPFSLSEEQKKAQLKHLVNRIKHDGRNKRYDCIIGLSGGVDSSYVALLVKELGLRPLAVHLDNGWNSEIAVANIENICSALNIDLYTHVLDWDVFKNMQFAFLKASTPDSEIPSDHAIYAILYAQAKKYKIKYILSGSNLSSEAILPKAWSQGHNDWKYIKGVCLKNGVTKFTTFPHYSLLRYVFYTRILKIKWVSLLDYFNYNKEEAKKIIEEKLAWRNYGRKHGESTYTKIFQEYILPIKFGYDKRRAHLSSLIIAGQLSRADALEKLREPLYQNKSMEDDDVNYLCNKFGISRDQFDIIMKAKPKTIDDYPNMQSSWYYKLALWLNKMLKGKK